MFDRLKKSIQRKSAPANVVQVRATSPATADASAEPTGANVPWAELDGLLQPGEAVSVPEIVEPEPVAAVVDPTPAPTPKPDYDHRPIDWREETRTDLPPRTPGRIAYLLRFETPAQIQARILNDGARYRNRRG